MHTERLVIKLYETDLINVTEYQTANQKFTIQRNWQQVVHKMKTSETNTTQYVLDTTSSLPSVVSKRAHVLFTLFVFVWFVFTSSCF
jgi:plasmid replication initiation protein